MISYCDCANVAIENLEKHFCTARWEAAHRDGRIQLVVDYHIDVSEIERPAVEPKFSTARSVDPHTSSRICRCGRECWGRGMRADSASRACTHVLQGIASRRGSRS